MRESITAAGLCFGKGQPKLCVPLTAATQAELDAQLDAVRTLPADLYEWRLDAYADPIDDGLALLKAQSERPLLCTLRTARDGGAYHGSVEEYESVLTRLVHQGGFSMLDVELSSGAPCVQRLIAAAHGQGMAAVVSYHDFTATPTEKIMTDLLMTMHRLGADLPKLAVMPQSPEDVLALLCTTRRVSRQIGPVITMAMGQLGAVSRVIGELTGSCMTFGAGVQASAPGQPAADTLKELLRLFSPEQTEGREDR